MGDTKKHHYVPRFLLKEWTNTDNKLWLYLKNDLSNSPKFVAVGDVGHEKNLYTSTGGDKSIETDFFGEIDRNASIVHKKILTNKELDITAIEKEQFTHFINTLYFRNPENVNMMKDFNETDRQSGLKFAERHFKETGENISEHYEKKQYDDTPKLIKVFSTIGEKTAMSKLYENDFNKIMSSKWIIFENKSVYSLITSDIPLEIVNFSDKNNNLEELPDKFGILLPLSTTKLLIISNNNTFFNTVKSMQEKEFVKKIGSL